MKKTGSTVEWNEKRKMTTMNEDCKTRKRMNLNSSVENSKKQCTERKKVPEEKEEGRDNG